MEWITSAINWISGNLAQIAQVVGVLAAIATVTPNKSDDKIVQWLLDLVNAGGGNIGKAKNDPAKE